MVLLEWQSRPSAGAMLIDRLTQKLVAKGTISRQITFEGHRISATTNERAHDLKCATSVTLMARLK